MREIADDVNVSVSAVSMWLQNMMTRGIGEDYEIKQGRPPKFTLEQLNQLSVDMRASRTVWSGFGHLGITYGCAVCIRKVWHFNHAWLNASHSGT